MIYKVYFDEMLPALQILLQDEYNNIDVSTVNVEFMWLGTKKDGKTP
jgi:hypothetical protein